MADRIYEWATLNNEEIARLDRLQTVILLPIGHTQQHGAHLPQGTTSFAVQRIVQETATLLTLTERTRHVVILPRLDYGADPVELKKGTAYKGTSSLTIRPQTLEAIVTDLTEGVVRNGFRYLFTIGHHAGPAHCRAIQKALEGVVRRFPALIAEDVFSYLYAGAAANAAPDLRTLAKRRVSPIEQAAVDTPGHGSTADTAIMLAIDANLVSPEYVTLEGIPEDNVERMPDWPGYYGGAPALAEADLGQAIITQQGYRCTHIIRKAIAGESLAELPRYPGY
jgi:creatinine amidohydrolase/Fe(II)-dependent formamide hydrolase-like protein